MDVVPLRVATNFKTAKGRRVGLKAFYNEQQISQIKKAMNA